MIFCFSSSKSDFNFYIILAKKIQIFSDKNCSFNIVCFSACALTYLSKAAFHDLFYGFLIKSRVNHATLAHPD